MPVAPACPPADDFRKLLRGELPDPDGERLAAHLSDCARCGGVVEELLARDTLLEALRARSTVPEPSRPGLVAELVARLAPGRRPPPRPRPPTPRRPAPGRHTRPRPTPAPPRRSSSAATGC